MNIKVTAYFVTIALANPSDSLLHALTEEGYKTESTHGIHKAVSNS